MEILETFSPVFWFQSHASMQTVVKDDSEKQQA